MKHRITIRYLLAAGLLILLQSCSLKEERSGCPCWLDVFFGNFPEDGLVLSAWCGEKLFSDDVSREDFVDFYEKEVKRGLVNISAYRNSEDLAVSGDAVIIAKGSQADSLYAYSSYVECFGEFAADTVSLYKQFSTVYLSFENTEDSLETRYSVCVKGNVCGTDISTLSPIEGEFEFCPEEIGTGFYQFRLPRQKDDSLVFELLDKENGDLVDTISAGVLIRESGYDWRTAGLNDIVITVDFSKLTLEVSVREWDSREIYDVTI